MGVVLTNLNALNAIYVTGPATEIGVGIDYPSVAGAVIRLSGGGSQNLGNYQLVQNQGVTLNGEGILNFSTGLLAVDDPANGRTTVTAVGGGVLRGTYANRPAAGTAGRFYSCSDIPFQYFDDGSAWHQLYHGEDQPAPPAIGSYTVVGDLQLDKAGDSFCVVNWSPSGAQSQRPVALVPQTLSPTALWTVRLDYVPGTSRTITAFPDVMVAVANGTVSGTSLAWCAGQFYNSTYGVEAVSITINTATRTVLYGLNGSLQSFGSGIFRSRLLCDGTDLHFQVSADGVQWYDMAPEGGVVHPCPSGLTQYGFECGGAGNLEMLVLQNTYTSGLTVPQGTVTGATGNAVPIQLTVPAHPFLTGDMVSVVGVGGNTNANTTGTPVQVIDANTIKLFALANGNASYTSGGVVTCLSR